MVVASAALDAEKEWRTAQKVEDRNLLTALRRQEKKAVKKKISPVVSILVLLAAIGIALGVMWLASEAPITDKPSVPFWLREGSTGGGPPGPPTGTPEHASGKAAATPLKGAVTIRKPATEGVSLSK